MDLSKLPKMSQTPPPPPPPDSQPSPQPNPQAADYQDQIAHVEAGVGGMVWVSVILGAICIWLGRQFASYVVAKVSGREFHTQVNWVSGPKTGQEVAYWELGGSQAWTDASIFLFGLALILEALALWVISGKMGGKKPVLAISLLVVVIATAFNLFTVVRIMGQGALPLMSVVAVAMGGYMAMYQWKLLRVLSTGRAAPMT
jgi:hypothetical protein